MSKNGMFIGEVAKQSGLSIHTIRFYEAQGLLPECRRAGSGFRVFSPRAVENLGFIRNMQELGFSLREIRGLQSLRDRSTQACSDLRPIVEKKLRLVRSKQRKLAAMEKELKRVRAECSRQLRRHRPVGKPGCPVLAKLSGTNQSSGGAVP